MAFLEEVSDVAAKLLPGYIVPYYQIKKLKLSVANPLHYLLLHELGVTGPEKLIGIPPAAYTPVELLLKELKGDLREEQLRERLREFYLALTINLPPKSLHKRDDNIFSADTAQMYVMNEELVASRLGAMYFQNFGITKEDIEQVLNDYSSACSKTVFDLDKEFLLRIANTYIDNRRYKLITVLPDSKECDLLKSVLREMQFKQDPEQALAYLKKDITQCLATYTSYWKFSLFGHHHNQRALMVITAINNCADTDEIRQILINQKEIMEGKETTLTSAMLSQRWSSSKLLINKKQEFTSSGYYQTLTKALLLIPLAQTKPSTSPSSTLN